MMLNYKEGDWFLDFAGPLGKASEVEKFGHVCMVGGGLGVAPIFPQLRAFKEAGNRTTAIIGFRSKDLMFWEDKFRTCDELIVCTDDGSFGKPGFVTVALKEVLATHKPELAVAIGPMVMMKACSDVTAAAKVKTIVSLNAIMVDGTGMCGELPRDRGGEGEVLVRRRPGLRRRQIDWTEIMKRQLRFKDHEARANTEYAHVCKMREELFDAGQTQLQEAQRPRAPPGAAHARAGRPPIAAKNFLEVNLGFTMDDALAEAERCIQCKKPTCIAGCPVAHRHSALHAPPAGPRPRRARSASFKRRTCSRRSAAASARRRRSARRSASSPRRWSRWPSAGSSASSATLRRRR